MNFLVVQSCLALKYLSQCDCDYQLVFLHILLRLLLTFLLYCGSVSEPLKFLICVQIYVNNHLGKAYP